MGRRDGGGVSGKSLSRLAEEEAEFTQAGAHRIATC